MIPDCTKKQLARGWCSKHYWRWSRNGSPLKASRDMSLTPEQRFWNKVQKTETCWVWKGHLDSKGYGDIRVNGKIIRAHRFSFYLANEFYPPSVLHDCDNPVCVNPAHLSSGTHQDNMRDRHQKGRDAKGENNGNVVLTIEKVKTIKELLNKNVPVKEIADLFNVAATTIHGIKQNRNWRHV